MTLVINTDKFRNAIKDITYKLGFQSKNIRDFWKVLAVSFIQNTNQTFLGEGYRGPGTQSWPKFSPRTLHPVRKYKINSHESIEIDYNKWNHRYGTDGAKKRRYTVGSRLLQASGKFKDSFRVLSENNQRIVYGTKHELANEIMSKPERPVLMVTDRDRRQIKKMVYEYALANKNKIKIK